MVNQIYSNFNCRKNYIGQTTSQEGLEGYETMTRLFLIIVMITQLGCTIVLETAAGSFIGHLAAEMVKDKIDEAEKDKAPQP